jgi:hypothetical protein
MAHWFLLTNPSNASVRAVKPVGTSQKQGFGVLEGFAVHFQHLAHFGFEEGEVEEVVE